MKTIVETFKQQGYVILKGAIEPAAVHSLKVEMEGLVDEPAAKLIAAHLRTAHRIGSLWRAGAWYGLCAGGSAAGRL